jgi:para-nitrobenzyl esterase
MEGAMNSYTIFRTSVCCTVIVICFGLSLPELAGSASAAEDALALRIAGGQIHGEAIDAGGASIRVFRGIPFAAPPLGELRWRPPQPVKPWKGTLQTVTFAPACIQASGISYGPAFKEQSEDCLYLNVWTAAKSEAEQLPVMMWIHGGGNAIGGASAPVYDGRNFAAAGVVLVSIQYRLGAFGYLAHPALTAEARQRDRHAASGNYGLMDQIAALKWIQANIGRFGGNKDSVTVFGESAGAADITHLMASPVAKGLFHRAIGESGYFGENTPMLDSTSGLAKSSAHQSGIELAQRLGVAGADEKTLKALRALPVDKIVSLPVTIGNLLGNSGSGERPFRFGPVVDGYILPRPPAEVWAAGQMQRIPFIAGSLLDDGWVFSRSNPIKRLVGYRLVLSTLFGSDFDRALQLFPAKDDQEVNAAVERLLTLLAFRAPARRLVRWIEAAGGESWLYLFSRNPKTGRTISSGVVHGLEIPYVFNTLGTIGDKTDKTLAAEMLQRWVTFARDGNPNGKDDRSSRLSPNWPKYTRDDDRLLNFGNKLLIEKGLDREACDFLDRLSRTGP